MLRWFRNKHSGLIEAWDESERPDKIAEFIRREGPSHYRGHDEVTDQIGGGQGGSQPINSPLDLNGCILWLDASTLALADDDPVATWPDGSSSGFDATQADSGSRPVCKTATQNGLRVVRFSTLLAPQWLNLTGDGLALLNGLDAASIIVCASIRDTTGGQVFAVLTNGNAARRFSIEYQGGSSAIADVTLRASNDDSLDAALIASLGSDSVPIVRTAAAAASASVATNEASTQTSATVWDASGGQGDSQLAAAGAFPNTNADAIQVGGDNTAPGPAQYDGDIFEIAVYNRILTARERRELLEYLSDKWATL